jgi:hypothetical protein
MMRSFPPQRAQPASLKGSHHAKQRQPFPDGQHRDLNARVAMNTAVELLDRLRVLRSHAYDRSARQAQLSRTSSANNWPWSGPICISASGRGAVYVFVMNGATGGRHRDLGSAGESPAYATSVDYHGRL